ERRIVRVGQVDAATGPLPDQHKVALAPPSPGVTVRAGPRARLTRGGGGSPSGEVRGRRRLRTARCEGVATVVRAARLGCAHGLPGALHGDEHGRLARGVRVRLTQADTVRTAQLLVRRRGRDPENLVGGCGEGTVEHARHAHRGVTGTYARARSATSGARSSMVAGFQRGLRSLSTSCARI